MGTPLNSGLNGVYVNQSTDNYVILTYTYICISYILNLGSGYELVDAVGVIIVGHFSIDGELKKKHFTRRHHNIFVVNNSRGLMEEIIELFSFPGQTVAEIIADSQFDQHSGT